MYKEYINFISDKNSKINFQVKFYNHNKNLPQKNMDNDNLELIDLNDKYYKVKECLSRCGKFSYRIF